MVTTTQTLSVRFNADPQGHAVLLNHPTQSATTVNGWGAIVFGLPFMAMGAFIAWMVPHGNPASKHAPDWVIQIFAGMFVLAGLFVFLHGVRDVVRKAAYQREAASRPNEPWLYDFHWRREGRSFSAFNEMVQRLIAAMLWTTFLVPFGWVGLHVHGAWPFLVAVGIFGLCSLIFWFRWAAMLFDLVRYGNSFLTYDSFPFSLSGTLRARLRSPHHVSAIDELTLTLRCVQEKYVTTGTGENRSSSVVCYELYKDVAAFDRDRLTGLAGNDIPVEFRLPSGQPSTTLAATPPIYWEIQANGKARGADYEAYFLVPVYEVSRP